MQADGPHRKFTASARYPPHMPARPDQPTFADAVRWAGLFLGPVLAIVSYLLLPTATLDDAGTVTAGLTQPGRATATVGVLMAVWWLSEAIPLPATALLPLVLFPLGGVATISDAAAPFANSVIPLFLGGLLLGLGMERWGLHKRIAMITLRIVGAGPRRLIAGFMIASAMLSMWVSNTATAIMMLPIALSVISLVATRCAPPGTPPERAASPDPNFDTSLLLGVAYAASIGGVATLIGSPPNAILAGFVADELGQQISFARWMLLGVPIVVVFLPLAWAYIVFFDQPVRLREIPGGRALIRDELAALGPMKRGEWVVFLVFCCTVVLWVTRPVLQSLGRAHGLGLLTGLNDSSIAIAGAIALFVIPVHPRGRVFAMDWETARRVPWGILLLFGGGLSLASAISANGVDAFIGASVGGLGHMPEWLAVVLVCTLVIFLTELTSNTAVTTALLPILTGIAPTLGVDPLRLVVPAALAASFAFMLPVATPPNAIVFSSGRIRVGQMARAGLGLNVLGVVVISLATLLLGGLVTNLGAGH